MDEDEILEILHVEVVVLSTLVVVISYMLSIGINVAEQRCAIPYQVRKCHRVAHLARVLGGSSFSSIEYLRMSRHAFLRLASILRQRALLRDTVHVSIEEQLAIFLHIAGHSSKNRVVKLNFIRSGETVSKYFNTIMRAIYYLRDTYVKQPIGSFTHRDIPSSHRWHPYFKDCIGFLDGTHIDARVPSKLVARFRGRKGVTQNVLAACDCDLKFTYVLSGWEGAANDMTVLKDALNKDPPYNLRLPEGKFYLVDAGYTTMPEFIVPYRKVRYHLKEYSGRRPTNSKELFNLRHSTLRSRIERCFGLLKNRFRILSSPPFYPLRTQVDLVLACIVLHNYILTVDPEDLLFHEVLHLEEEILPEQELPRTEWQHREASSRWKEFRDKIADDMWRDYSATL